MRFVILTPGVANAHGSNETIRNIFKVASPQGKIKINGRKGLSKPTTSAITRSVQAAAGRWPLLSRYAGGMAPAIISISPSVSELTSPTSRSAPSRTPTAGAPFSCRSLSASSSVQRRLQVGKGDNVASFIRASGLERGRVARAGVIDGRQPRRHASTDRPDHRKRGLRRIASTRLAHSHRSKDQHPGPGIVLPPACPRHYHRQPLLFR